MGPAPPDHRFRNVITEKLCGQSNAFESGLAPSIRLAPVGILLHA